VTSHRDMAGAAGFSSGRPSHAEADRPNPSAGALAAERVSVIVVLHNSAVYLNECLLSIPDAAEVIVVDNASTDDGRRIVATVSSTRPVRFERLEDNRGFGAGCNAGAALATRPFLVFLNPDAALTPGAIESLVMRITRLGPAIVGPRLVSPEGTTIANCRRPTRVAQDIMALLPYVTWWPNRWRRDLPPGHPIYTEGGETCYVQGACMIIPADLFRAIGGFDDDYFLYYEEEALADSARARGAPSWFEPTAVVRHVGGTSTPSAAAWFHHSRSLVIYQRKTRGRLIGLTSALAILGATVPRLGATLISRLRGRDATTIIAQTRTVQRGCLAGVRAVVHPRV
jgi:N-acetylglucosaminyl-diphospho-decaprenol L-rhamnosyltransferase